MYLVAIGWLYVVLMMAVAEALSSQGSVLGAIVTFVLYGVLPLALVLYILNTPARKRALRGREEAELAAAAALAAAPAQAPAPAGLAAPDGGGHAAAAPTGAVTSERKEG